ncbi:MAG: glycosyltransferase [Lewinellaceae bacterium]|nr:glycosyltransferase [Lewinellaceae bacterium]
MNCKVVFVIPHIPDYDDMADMPRPDINWDTPDGNWVGIWGLDWGNQIGDNILKYFPELEFEVWQPDLRADKVYSHTFESGVVQRLIPASILNGEVVSEPMMRELEKAIAVRPRGLVIQVDGRRSALSENLLGRFSDQAPILNQYLGSLSNVWPNYDFRVWRWLQRYFRAKRFLKYILEKQKYLAILDLIPRGPAFEKIAASPDKKIFRHFMGMTEDFFSEGHDKAAIRKKWNIPVGNTVFLSASRLNRLKQIVQIVNAFGKVREEACTLLICGAGSDDFKDQMNSAIEKQHNDVRFLGFLTGERLTDVYKLSDVFIDASLDDGAPFSAWQAMGTGLGVITTATGNAGGFLKKHQAGVYIPRKKVGQWTPVFEAVASGKMQIKRVPIQAVRDTIGWAVCAERKVAIYRAMLEDFHGALSRDASRQGNSKVV